MQLQTVLLAMASLAAVSDATVFRRTPFDRALKRRQFDGDRSGGGFGNGDFGNGNFDDGNNDDNNDNNNNDNGGGGGGGACLDSSVIQQGSAQDGQADQEAGQSPSATDDANFANFCQGKDLTNGEQKEGGSCNGIVMGNIPSTNNMVSSVFTSPQNGDTIASNQDFDVSVQMINFAPGTFTNPDNTYYSAPQDLDGSGNIIGHTHVTIQDTGNDQNPTTPLDPTQFAFFKGINDQGNGQGLLSATVDGGLPAGNYRLCSMASSANHQPVLMPVAQRGAQDDCIRFTVSDDGGNDSGDNNGDDNGADNGDDNNGGFGDNNGGFGDNNGGFGGNNGGFGDNNGGFDDNNGDDNGDNNGSDNGDNNGDFGNGSGGNDTFGGGSSSGDNDGSDTDDGNQGDSGDSGNDTNGGGGGSGGATQSSALGGIAAQGITDTGDLDRPFGVAGNSFTDKEDAVERACAIQANDCANAVNSGQMSGVSVNDCQAQVSACVSEMS